MSHRGSGYESLVLALSLVAVFGAARPAWATLENFKNFKQAYPGKDAKAYSCKICHLNAIGKKEEHNAYGTALQTLKGEGLAKTLTLDDYRAIEKDDADNDGVSNLDEINAGTAPGDPASVPQQ